MVVKTIYISRHGLRGTWNLNLETGVYTSNVLSGTKIHGDPPLVAYGVAQAQELAAALSTISPPIARIYSSPYYRCLETIQPTAEKLGLPISTDNGLGEWFGHAWFRHPVPAQPDLLASLIPMLDSTYIPSCYPSAFGESLTQLHDRLAYALFYIIWHADSVSGDDEIAIQICTHAAPLIAIGRVLTGNMPAKVDEQDFKTHTAGISKFERKSNPIPQFKPKGLHVGDTLPSVNWAEGRGVMGGWVCTVNCDCSHLKGGEERGWFFTGDEAFSDPQKSTPKADGIDGASRL